MIVISIYLKVALGVLIVASVFQLIGLAAPYWSGNGGLWQRCDTGYLDDQYLIFRPGCRGYFATDALIATRAFEVIGFIFLAIVLLLLLIFIFKDANLILILISLILSFVAAGWILGGIIIWIIVVTGTGHDWAFMLCIVAGILALIVGIFIILERRSRLLNIEQRGDCSTLQCKTTSSTIIESKS